MPTAIEIAQGRQTPLTAQLLMLVQTDVPLFMAFDARTTTATRFVTLAVVSLPQVGFSHYNEGFESSQGILAMREFDCSHLGGIIMAEKITTQKWNKEHPSLGYTYMDLQVKLHIEAQLKNVERQMIYGTVNDAKGFPGMKQITPFAAGNTLTLDDSADDYDFTKTVINAGGTSAGNASSVYSIVFGDLDTQLVFGDDNGGDLIQFDEVTEETLAPDPTKPEKKSRHYVQQASGHVGLAVGGFSPSEPNQQIPTQYSLRRLANLTAEAGKGLDDKKLSSLVYSHPTGKEPSILTMSPRSGDQLAKSRSAASVFVSLPGSSTHNGSMSLHVPRPDNFEGIPIVYTSSIKNTDAIEV